MTDITVRKVEDKADFKAFFEFPWKLYKDYPYWIADLPSMRRDMLNKKKHAAWEYMEGDYFVAWQNGEAVGTIAAFVNHRHNEYHKENVGFFGCFECIDNQEIANALFRAAEEQLKTFGVDAIRGPASFTVNEYFGLLGNGFDDYPTVLMPYNPEYYIRLIESFGFQKAMKLLSWRLPFEDARPMLYEADGVTKTRIHQLVEKNSKRRDITVRPINMRDKKNEFKRLKDLYNVAWEKNWGFVPLNQRELDELERDLGLLLLPKYTLFASVKGELAGFMLLIPDMNQVMRRVRANPRVSEIWWLLKALWHFKIRPKATNLRIILL